MIVDFIWNTFGLIEWLLCIELVTMLSAAFFYQVAKLIARTDRHDPLVKFYRVFWQSFFSSVRSVKELDAMQAEIYARDAGLSAAGRMTDDQLSNLDAPDLGDFGGVESTGVREPEQPAPGSVFDEAEASEPVSAPAPAPRKRPSGGSNAAAEEQRSLKSTFDARIVPFSPKDTLAGRDGNEVVVHVTVAPEDGQANGTIINLVAARLQIRPYQIALLRGHYKVRKTFQVSGLDQASLNARLSGL